MECIKKFREMKKTFTISRLGDYHKKLRAYPNTLRRHGKEPDHGIETNPLNFPRTREPKQQ